MADSLDYLNVPLESSFATPLSNSTLLPLLLLSLAQQEKHTPDTLHNASQVEEEYDYVIVGAGTAGSVVAARLSEIDCIKVLLLEAGPPSPRITDVPGVSIPMWKSNLTWNFVTTPQNHTCSALVDREVQFLGGKCLGGSSTITAGVYVRGNKKDYNDWVKDGANGWSYDDVLPYFKKSENNTFPEFVKNGYHGTEGPGTVSKPDYEAEIKEPLIQAAADLGYEFVDPNGPTQRGFYDLQGYLRGNRRCSTAKAYLVPAENRTNLHILPNAFVRKVQINNGRATGVIYDFDGQTYEVSAKREVIMSAGALNTPRLLMLSGIGPEEELKKFNISVAADLPVGKNLQDHSGFPVFFVLNSSIPEFSKKLSDLDNIQQYIDNRTGPLASAAGMSVIAFLQSNQTQPYDDFPNYSIFFIEEANMTLSESMNVKPEVYQKIFGPHIKKPIMICYSFPLQPKGKGTVTLRSTNPYDTPVVDPNYLGHPQDRRNGVEGMKACRQVGSNSHMSEVVSHILETATPECEEHDRNEDTYLECILRSASATLFHYCGTAKMGDPNDNTTVVDPKLRVKHIDGLRVVDASVMPTITSGNTLAPTIMIAEKAADIIKKTIECSEE